MSMNANGFSGTEIVQRVIDYVGDTSSTFENYMLDSLNLAQFKFCKAHDWDFLQRSDLLLACDGTGGPNNFDLASITDPVSGNAVTIPTSSISMIHTVYPGVVLRKISIQDLRRFDPQETNGTIVDTPTMWCPVSEKRFKIWPDNFDGGASVSFKGALAGQSLPLLTATSSLSPTVNISVVEAQGGGSGKNERQVIKFDNVPLSGTFTLTYGANTTVALAYNASAATIQAALEALPSVGVGNIQVDNKPITGLLSLDCKVLPTLWSDYSLPPIIPFKYQESFICYMIALGLDYIDDSRFESKKQEALELVKADIQDDLNKSGDVDLPRVRSMFEARLDGAGANLNALLFGFLAPYD